MLKEELEDVVRVYLNARDDFQLLVGATPENYRILIFINPELHISVNRVLEETGTPQAILTGEQITNLRSARVSDFLPIGKETVYNSLPTLIYLSVPSYDLEKEQEFTLRVMLVHALAHAYMNENTQSNSAKTLSRLYQIDVILKELMTNNVYKLNQESAEKHVWAWQYFQDLIGVIRLFTESGVEDFYTPPEDARKYTLFNNFSIEAINLLGERAKIARRKHLHELIEEGFAHYIQIKEIEYLLGDKQFKLPIREEDKQPIFPNDLKAFIAPPIGEFGIAVIKKLLSKVENEEELFEKLFSYTSDLELLEEFTWDEVKDLLAVNKNTHSESVVERWHSSKSRWTDIWSVYAYGWRLIEEYTRKIYRRKYSTFGQLLDDKPAISSKGYVKVGSKKVYVFEVNDNGVGIDQLVILHNHMSLYRDDFRTILPAFADVIVIKKIGGIHVASLFAVHKTRYQPLSPYNIPVITRAVQVTKRKDAYKFELDEEKEEKFDVSRIDYTYLRKLTQPQRGAIAYLIKEGMYEL
ncbi:MAG: hypothetical protein ACXABK_00230 [Candidatus Heimdallarchaeaceae archaeon]|jgi:hypothetical protein